MISEPEHLLVLRFNRDGTFEEEYNGPGALVWNLLAHKPLAEKRPIPDFVLNLAKADETRRRK
jgi:hypothetical protein